MNYWQMELHPNEEILDLDVGKLLKEKAIIGLGHKSKKSQLENFKNKMKVGDIVVIRKGVRPVAIVQVTGDCIDLGNNTVNQIAWFKYVRKVKVLDFAENMDDFPFQYLPFRISTGKKTKTFQYIHDWHEKLRKKQYSEQKEKEKCYKIQSVYIEELNMFNGFKLNLVSDNKLLPVVVIAGKNGTGKTSLLEYLYNYKGKKGGSLTIGRSNYYSNDISAFGKNKYFKIYSGMKGIREKTKEYTNHIYYLPFLKENNYSNVEEEIVNYYIYRGEVKDLKRSEMLAELQSFIDDIFEGFNLSFKVAKVDLQTKQVFFTSNNSSENIFNISELSSGEKTLLSKVLLLYLKRFTNKIVLIDEPELSLHPAWQNRVLSIYEKFAIENNCQIIIATHSPHIIGSAKNEYLRILRFNDEGNVEVVNDVENYGRDIAWVLEEVMGTDYTREKSILDSIKNIESLIDEEKYSEAEDKIDALEKDIGKHDKDLVRLRTVLEFEMD